MIYQNDDQLKRGCESILACEEGDVRVLNEPSFRDVLIDDLIYTAVFSPDPAIQEAAAFLIRRGAANLGIVPASIQSLYEAMGRKRSAGLPFRRSISGHHLPCGAGGIPGGNKRGCRSGYLRDRPLGDRLYQAKAAGVRLRCAGGSGQVRLARSGLLAGRPFSD